MTPIEHTALFFLIGLLGGLARSLVGLMKAITKNEALNPGYWFLTITCAAVIGALMGIVFDIDKRIAALAGYAGIDILENVYKSFKSTNSVLSVKPEE